MNQSRKKAPNYARNKKAFDTVMQAYRDSSATSALGAVQYNEAVGHASRYEAKPTPLDFRCDVDRVIKKCVKDKFTTVAFVRAYIWFDSIDSIEMEMHAEKLMGKDRHALEQRIGAEFCRRRLYPTSGKKGYFSAIRRPHAKAK